MPELPNVTVAPTTDGGLVGFVHQGMKVRTIFAASLDAIRNRLPGVLIAEFGMGSEEAAAHADSPDGKQLVGAASAPAPVAAADKALMEQLGAAHEHVDLLQEQLTEAQAELEVERATSADLKAKLAAANALLNPPQPDTPPEQSATGLGTEPQGQSPVAGDGSPPQEAA